MKTYTESQYIGICWWAFTLMCLFFGAVILLMNQRINYEKQVKFANKRIIDIVNMKLCTNCYVKELDKRKVEFLHTK